MLPGSYNAVIRLNAAHVPSDEECAAVKTACGKGLKEAEEGLKGNGLDLKPCLGLKAGMKSGGFK